MTKFSNKSKKPFFWPIFAILEAKTKIKKIQALSHTTANGPLTPCSVSENTNEQIPRKLPDRRTERWTDRR